MHFVRKQRKKRKDNMIIYFIFLEKRKGKKENKEKRIQRTRGVEAVFAHAPWCSFSLSDQYCWEKHGAQHDEATVVLLSRCCQHAIREHVASR